MSIVRQMRGGRENDPNFGTRMSGTGNYAELMEKRFDIACRRFGLNERRRRPRTARSRLQPLSAPLRLLRSAKVALMRISGHRRGLGVGRGDRVALAHALAARGRHRARRQARPFRLLRPADVLVCPVLPATRVANRLRPRLHCHGRRTRVRAGPARLPQLRRDRHVREQHRRAARLGRRAWCCRESGFLEDPGPAHGADRADAAASLGAGRAAGRCSSRWSRSATPTSSAASAPSRSPASRSCSRSSCCCR